MEEFNRIFKALSDPNRVRILKMLEFKTLCVCEITSILNLSTSTVSSHLSLLKDIGFITDSKDGKWVEYTLIRTSANPVLHQVMAMMSGWLNNEQIIQSDKRIAQKVDREIICLTLNK